MTNNIIKEFFIDLDKNLAILGIVLSIILLFFSVLGKIGINYSILSVLLFVFCIIWIRIRQNNKIKLNVDFESKRIFIICNLFFFLFFIGSLLTYYFRSNLYQRPLLYFIFISLMVGAVALGIMFLPKKNIFYGIILSEIIIIGLNLTYSPNLLFSGVVGVDPWAHQMFTKHIIETGRILGHRSYSMIPFFHLEIASAAMINNLDYKIATLLTSNFLVIALNALMVFLLGKFFFSDKVGLFGSLFLIIANYNLVLASWTIPNSVAAIFIIPIIYLVFKFDTTKEKKIIFIIFLFMIAVILTHSIVSMAVAIILLSIWLAFKFYKKIYKKMVRNPIGLSFILFFVVSMFSWWTYASGHLATLAHLIKMGFSEDYFFTITQASIQYANTIPVIEKIFDNLGFNIYISMAIIGMLLLISKKFGEAKNFSYSIIGFVILAIAFVPPLTGQFVIEQRWFYFAQILLAIPLGLSTIILINMFRKKNIKPILLLCFSIGLSFIMIISTTAQFDNPVLGPHIAVRFGEFQSELNAAAFISVKSNSSIYSDYDYFSNPISSIPMNYFNVSSERVISLDNNLLIGNFNNLSGTIVVRNEIANSPFRLKGQVVRLDYDIYKVLDSSNSSIIYVSNSVKMFYQ